MSKQRNKDRRLFFLVALIVLVVAAIAGILLWDLIPQEQASVPAQTVGKTDMQSVVTTQQPDVTTEPGMQLPIDLGEGLYVTEIENFSGVYMEDGTDDVVQGLLMIVLENRGEQALQYARISLDYGDAQAHFDVTNLPAGGKVVLLEKNRMSYRGDLPQAAFAENVALLDAFPMHEDVFLITTADGVINVRNISGTDITGDIFIYYKNVGGGLYYGGITYRVRIEGGLKADEIRQMMTAHYYEDASEILMVTYAQ